MTEQIIPDYLSYATENHASDIFIIAGRPLSVKIDGKMSIYGERLMPDDTDRPDPPDLFYGRKPKY